MKHLMHRKIKSKDLQDLAKEIFDTYNITTQEQSMDANKLYKKLLIHNRLTNRESIYVAYMIDNMKNEILRLQQLVSIYDPNGRQNLLFDAMTESLSEKDKELFYYDDPKKKGFRISNDEIYYDSKPLKFKGKPRELLYVFLTAENNSRTLTKQELIAKLRWRENLVRKNIHRLKNNLRYIYGDRYNDSIQSVRTQPLTYKLYLPEEL